MASLSLKKNVTIGVLDDDTNIQQEITNILELVNVEHEDEIALNIFCYENIDEVNNSKNSYDMFIVDYQLRDNDNRNGIDFIKAHSLEHTNCHYILLSGSMELMQKIEVRKMENAQSLKKSNIGMLSMMMKDFIEEEYNS